MDEVWKAIKGYEGFYEVSNQGHVRALARTGLYIGRWGELTMRFPAKVMKISSTPDGYKYVTLKYPNLPCVKHLVHRLVMQAFIGDPPPEQPQVNHIDGKKGNNRIENLEYCSSRENLLHLTRVLKRKIGGAGGYSKLTIEQARSALLDQRPLKQIATELGVSFQAIWLLKKGRNWSHLQPTTPPTSGPEKS